MAKRTWFAVEALTENGIDIIRVAVHEELWKALREAKKLYEEWQTDARGYASVWGVYATTPEKAFDAKAYVRVWSSSEDPPLELPKA